MPVHTRHRGKNRELEDQVTWLSHWRALSPRPMVEAQLHRLPSQHPGKRGLRITELTQHFLISQVLIPGLPQVQARETKDAEFHPLPINTDTHTTQLIS